MVEISLQWLVVLAISFLVLAFGFTMMLVYMLYTRLGGKEISSQKSEGKQAQGLLGGLEERLFERRRNEVVVAPPVQGEGGKQWLLLYRQPQSQALTLSLPEHEMAAVKDDLSPAELLAVKDMWVGLQHWLGNDAIVAPVLSRPVPIVSASAEEAKNTGMGGLLFNRKREVADIVPMDSIAVQINTVLQNMLLQENYQGTAIHLDENEAGDLVIWVGSQSYVGLENIPDVQVTEIVRRAAQRWTDQNLAK
jgi:hypothetical protein